MLKRRRTEQDNLLGQGPVAPSPSPVAAPRPPARAAAPPPPRAPEPEVEAPVIPREVYAPERPRPRPRKRRRGIILVLRPIAVAVAVLAGSYLSLPWLLGAGRLRVALENMLGHELGRQVQIGSLKFTLGLGGLIVSDVTISEDPAFGKGTFATIRRVTLGVDRLPLIFGGKIEIRSVALLEPNLTLVRNAARHWNYASMLTASPPLLGAGPAVDVREGVVTIRSAGLGGPVTLRHLVAAIPRFSSGIEMTLAISASVDGGGTAQLNGNAGPFSWNRGSPGLPIHALVNARKVALAASNLTTTAPGLDGSFTFDGTIDSNGATITVTGNAKVNNVRLARSAPASVEPVLLALSVQHDLDSRQGTISRGEIHLGKGSADLTGSYRETAGRTEISWKVGGRGVPATPLGSLLAAAGFPLPPGTALQGGVAFLDLDLSGTLEHPAIGGTLTVENTKLMGFDFGESVATISGMEGLGVGRGLDIDKFGATLAPVPDRISFERLDVDLAGIGTISGGGAILDDRSLDLKMDLVRANGDRHPIPFIVRGPCSAPIFRQPGRTR